VVAKRGKERGERERRGEGEEMNPFGLYGIRITPEIADEKIKGGGKKGGGFLELTCDPNMR